MKQFIFSFLIGASFFAGMMDPAKSADCESMETVPFAGASDWQVLSDGENFCVQSDHELVRLGSSIPLAVDKLNPHATIVTMRESISSYLAVGIFKDDQSIQFVELTFDQRSKLHPEATFIANGAYYLLSYNIADNLPSGRRREVPRSVLALHRLSKTGDKATLELVNDTFLDGDIEVGALVANDENTVLICAASSCRFLRPDSRGTLLSGDVVSVTVDGSKLDIIEIAAGSSKAYALAQRIIDDRFANPAPGNAAHFFLCDVSEASKCEGLDPESVPYNLRVENGVAVLDDARKSSSMADLVNFDLTRVGLNGLANLGENNMEGRIAWSQVYYLNGLLSLSDLSVALGLPEDLKSRIVRRVQIEIKAMSRIAETAYPGFLVRRYALDREPYPSLLHNARVLKAVWRAGSRVLDDTLASFAQVSEDTLAARNAIERFDQAAGGAPARGFIRKYFPFWADGARVPWNFQSGWIEAVAWAPVPSESARQMAASMILDFLDTEGLAKGRLKWGYVIGSASTGWSAADGISSNTPDYPGDTANSTGAHISYRSMDAMAVLAAMRSGITARDSELLNHLSSLVGSGALYPFVNEELRLIGAEQEDIPFEISRLYVRSRLPWQVQNQPWALKSISQVSK